MMSFTNLGCSNIILTYYFKLLKSAKEEVHMLCIGGQCMK